MNIAEIAYLGGLFGMLQQGVQELTGGDLNAGGRSNRLRQKGQGKQR